MTIDELNDYILSLGEPKYRAKQIFSWIYKGATDFNEMVNIPKTLRIKLGETSFIGRLDILDVKGSKTDGTKKYLFDVGDDAIESVFMKYKYGNSICISSQAGCRMGCRFCASTRDGLLRNLTAGEMVSQVLETIKNTGEYIGHIVVMGTGEPFDNYENLSRFIEIVHCKDGLGLSNRNITVSTCGLVPRIYDFAKEYPQVNLAISLHAPTDEKRSEMMPINNKYSIAEVIKAAKYYTETTGRRVTFEYTMVNGVNDSDYDAEVLSGLLKGILCHVNLIPLNKVSGSGFDTVSRGRAEEFGRLLASSGIPVTVRRELGADIDAACGQLRLRSKRREEKDV